VRTLRREDGKVNPGKSTFTPGSLKNKVRLFDFESGKDLGGYRFSAKNSDIVSSKSAPDNVTVMGDLDREAQAAINAAIDKMIAGN
jgi:hypothetical protein